MNRDAPAASGCTACGDVSAPRLLHNVRHRGVFHRLCTPCVLRFHPASFCPTCLDVFDQSPPSDAVRCSKCTSVSHSACVTAAEDALDSSYVCPSCLSPGSRLFEIDTDGPGGKPAIDQRSAKVLLAAARVSAASMGRALAVARMEVDRKVKEAAAARKRAREALERVEWIALMEKNKNLQGLPTTAPEAEQKKRPKANSAVAAAVAAQKRIQDSKLGGFSTSAIGFHTPLAVVRPLKNGVSVEEKDKLKGPQQSQNHALQEETVKSQGSSGPSAPKQQQRSDITNFAGEEGKLKKFTSPEMGPSQLNQLKQGECLFTLIHLLAKVLQPMLSGACYSDYQYYHFLL
ncbi:hypothetical protein ACLOJK_015739 [Asimina triloba]